MKVRVRPIYAQMNGPNHVSFRPTQQFSIMGSPSHKPSIFKFLQDLVGIYVPFIVYNILREKLTTKSYQWQWSLVLVWIQVTVNLIYCLVVDGKNIFNSKVGWGLSWIIVGVFTNLSMILSNVSLSYVNYPTQVLARSCKPIAVLISTVIISKERYPIRRYVAVVALCLGISLFLISSSKKKSSSELPQQFLGYVLLFIALALDGILNGLQQKFRRTDKPSPLQSMFFVNLYGWFFVTILMLVQYEQEILPAFEYLRLNPSALIVITVSSVSMCIGSIFIFETLSDFGTLVLAIITTVRKFFTLLLSVFWYGHEMTLPMWIGASIVFLSITMDRYFAEADKSKLKKK